MSNVVVELSSKIKKQEKMYFNLAMDFPSPDCFMKGKQKRTS
jgi:hypothetical protein